MPRSTSPCWSCGALHSSEVACPLCAAPYVHAASIRLTEITEMETELRGYLGSVARLANSALKHGERELSTAAAATETQLGAALRSLREQRAAVKRDVLAHLAARPVLASVPYRLPLHGDPLKTWKRAALVLAWVASVMLAFFAGGRWR